MKKPGRCEAEVFAEIAALARVRLRPRDRTDMLSRQLGVIH